MKQTTPIIPRSVLFGNPDRARPTVSPDGRWLAFLAPEQEVMNVYVGAPDKPATARAVTHDRERGVRTYFWSYTGRHLLYIQDRKGDENWHLYAVDVETRETSDLTPIDGVHAQVQELSPQFPDEILVGLNDREPSLHDIYRIHIITGERTLVMKNPGMAGFITDQTFSIRFAVRMTSDGGSETLLPAGDGSWKVFMQVGSEDVLTTSFAGFDASGEKMYLLDSRGRDTSALFEVLSSNILPGSDLTEHARLLCESDKADVDDVLVHPKTREVQAASYTYERKSWVILDETVEADLATLRKTCSGEVEVVSRTRDDSAWTVAFLTDDGPVRYYYYDRTGRIARFLFTNNDRLEGAPLVPQFTAVIPARDGLSLVAYVSLPGADSAGNDRSGIPVPATAFPTVLYVHGGPWARDTWGYNPTHQWLANRGYAVISVNFRSSTGFGKAFLNAGNLEWGRAMHHDLLDTVQWAVSRGIADPERVAIMGGSYGGYATLAALTMTPEVFACGVDLVGPSSLLTLIESVPEYWKPQLEILTTRVGDHRTEDGRALLAERSPLSYADRIVRPLLIAQGANDPRVKQAESDRIVGAMKENNIPVTYLLYPDEGHGFARPGNRISFYAATEAFLSNCLGGRYEATGDALDDSSVHILEGRIDGGENA